ncbi:hypothetical protein V1290_007257 [Bradyrhizobium sp. AZCC 1578]|uniref:hypothetical protein n=1 Tax=Bradyrhizobium sp. AZCC 1578 TaxID=3117027 RepID=UPI002FF0CAF7
MAFFRRELGPIERFEVALKDKLTARQKLAERLSVAESELAEKRAAAERLAVAGADNSRLDRAEASMRAVEDRAKTLRAELVEFDDQVASAERALADAKTQRDRDALADEIEAMAAAIERAAPGFEAGATTLVEAVTKSSLSIPEASRFSASVDAVRSEVRAAADLICWELRSAAVRTRAGNANLANPAPSLSEEPPSAETERQLMYTLHPLRWREDGKVRKVPAFALVGLPKALLPVALQHQHVDHLNARRVQTLMHLHGSAGNGEPQDDDPQLVDLDALLTEETQSAQADVA